MIDERLQKLSTSLAIQRFENLDLVYKIHQLERAHLSEVTLLKLEASRKDDQMKSLVKLCAIMDVAAFIAGMILEYLLITNYGK